jgi:hypothetical protein
MCSGDPLNDMATKMEAYNPFFSFFYELEDPLQYRQQCWRPLQRGTGTFGLGTFGTIATPGTVLTDFGGLSLRSRHLTRPVRRSRSRGLI